MTFLNAHRCQFCGDVLFHDDFFSDPSQHFCLTVNGPGMVDPHANGADIIKSNTKPSITESTTRPSTRKSEVPRRADAEYLSGAESDTSCASA